MSMLSPERKRSLAAKAAKYASNLQDERAVSYLESRGISIAAAEMFSIGYVPEGQEYAGRISIPYLGLHGCRDIKYRAIDDSKPKYLKEAGCGTNLYNSLVLRDAQVVALVEGEFDAIAVQAYCGVAAVGYPGVSTWGKANESEPEKDTAHWPLCFEGIPKVLVIADGDSPGRDAAQHVAATIGWSARVVDLGDGYDANKYIAEHGAVAFKKEIGL